MALPSLNIGSTGLYTALKSFLTGVLPSGVEVRQGWVNRVPEPAGSDFVVMWEIRRERLETNYDTYGDCAFTGVINNGTTLTISDLQFGTVGIGNTLFGSDVAVGTTIVSQLGGTSGGVGAYLLSQSSGTVGSALMACGVLFAMQPTEVTVQLDVHGPNSSDNAQIITTLFRDDYAVEQFKTLGGTGFIQVSVPNQTQGAYPPIPPPFQGFFFQQPIALIAPIHADDPRFMVFINDQNQAENRWIVEARLQANQIVTAPQQFASVIQVNTTLVDTIPPGISGGTGVVS